MVIALFLSATHLSFCSEKDTSDVEYAQFKDGLISFTKMTLTATRDRSQGLLSHIEAFQVEQKREQRKQKLSNCLQFYCCCFSKNKEDQSVPE